MRAIPNRYGNQAVTFDGLHAACVLDILDETSHGRRLLPILSHLTESEDPTIAAKATLFVGRRLQNPFWTKRKLGRKDQRIRANAVETLWGINTSPAIHLLEQCAGDSNNRVVGNALLGLYVAGIGTAKQEIMTLPQAGQWEFRSTAAWAMGRFAAPGFKRRLTELVRDQQPSVRSAALRALIAVRRQEENAIEEITVCATSQAPGVIDETIERAFKEILAPRPPRQPQLRPDESMVSAAARR